ncbi:MAG: Type 1 glutamine amidotransferase-like domain-containing protein [Candidatus Shapirobacteria bacterium]|jgi:peptidase E
MSQRIVLFSQPSLSVFKKLKSALFPGFLSERIFAYMPSDGTDREANEKYSPIWQDFAKNNGASFVYIDNSQREEKAEKESQKLLSSNILVITGGNTFKLLHHLRLSGLGKAIKDFWKKDRVVLSGFSAGAIVLSPSINTAKTGVGDANELGITDLTSLGILDFEVWPHYESSQAAEVAEYRAKSNTELKTITNDEIVVIEQKY